MNSILPMTLIRAGGLPLDVWPPLSTGLPDWAALFYAEQTAAKSLRSAFDAALSALPESPLRTDVYNARKDFFQRKKTPSGPLSERIHAADNLTELQDALGAEQKARRDIQAATELFEVQLTQNFQQLQSLLQTHQLLLSRCLLYASHDLLEQLPRFIQKPVGQFDKKDRQTAFGLLRYLTRAIFKTSPFGRLTTLELREWPDLNPPPFEIEKTLVSPNVALLPALYEVLLREPAFFQSLNLGLNPGLTSRSESPGYTWLYFDGEREAFQEVDSDPVLDFVVRVLRERALLCKELLAALSEQVDAREDQLQNLVFQLVDMGMLEWKLPEQGLSPGWCGGLYQHLGFLPSSPVLTDAAYLLQWLRTAARVLPFQSVEAAKAMQGEAMGEVRAFFQKHGTEPPPIPTEQLFFEDVVQASGLNVPVGEMEKLLGQLAECWRQRARHAQDSVRLKLRDFARHNISEAERMDFLVFAKRFLAQPQPVNPDHKAAPPPYSGKVGALLQVFQEDGSFRAVVNALYPGGGKLFARWLPILSPAATAKMKEWNTAPAGMLRVSFPWQGWSNANFQPLLSEHALAVPDARVGCLAGGRTLRLADVAVGKNSEGWPQLLDKQTGQGIRFNDLGLEAPDSRPPVVRLLWHLGVPFVSAVSLLPETVDMEDLGEGVQYRGRVEYGALVLLRATWVLQPDVCRALFALEKARGERIGAGIARMKGWGIPRLFFGRVGAGREKPQSYDMGSPLSMLMLEKQLGKAITPFLITEMLPMPEQCLGDRVGEFVVEIEV